MCRLLHRRYITIAGDTLTHCFEPNSRNGGALNPYAKPFVPHRPSQMQSCFSPPAKMIAPGVRKSPKCCSVWMRQRWQESHTLDACSDFLHSTQDEEPEGEEGVLDADDFQRGSDALPAETSR